MTEINNEKYWEYNPITADTSENESYFKNYSEKAYVVHVVYKSGKSYNHYVPKSKCILKEGKLLVPDWCFNHNKKVGE